MYSDTWIYENGMVNGGCGYETDIYPGIFYEHPNHAQNNVGSFTHQLFNKSILICYYNT